MAVLPQAHRDLVGGGQLILQVLQFVFVAHGPVQLRAPGDPDARVEGHQELELVGCEARPDRLVKVAQGLEVLVQRADFGRQLIMR